nr:MAG TPA: hypothetical protein [Caudoviricetes sp.]
MKNTKRIVLEIAIIWAYISQVYSYMNEGIALIGSLLLGIIPMILLFVILIIKEPSEF